MLVINEPMTSKLGFVEGHAEEMLVCIGVICGVGFCDSSEGLFVGKYDGTVEG